jgi:predicted RecB family nuclease
METGYLITAAVFAAFLKCPTKAYLLTIGEPTPHSFFADIEACVSSTYSTAAKRGLCVEANAAEPLDFRQLLHGAGTKGIKRYVNSDTAVYVLTASAGRLEERRSQQSTPSGTLVPILFSPSNKPDISDNLRLCFGALALSQRTGIVPDTGILLYGDGPRCRTVNIGNHADRTRQTIELIVAIGYGQKAPPLVLNRHCAVCDFQPNCRTRAIERDDLSLLSAMTVKERTKCSAKGISTITQLSYGYRPRRRKRTRPDAERSAKATTRAASVAKNDHKLKALAVKKNQIHVVGSPSLCFAGVPVFLDVEGMPDKDFYYLIGLRFERRGEQIERSFWADGFNSERLIWESCLRELKAIHNAQIVCYGAYDIRFLRQMRARYVVAPDDAAFVDRLIDMSVNLVGRIYSTIYFPTYSNSLKEIGRYLGCEWTWVRGSGAAAPLLRRAWELGLDDTYKCELIRYNIEDCRATATIADVIIRLCAGGASNVDSVNVGSLEVSFQRTFGKFDSALPEFRKINGAAYWDYQRSKVYARTDKTVRRTVRKAAQKRQIIKVNKDVMIAEVPTACPKCNAPCPQVLREDSYVVSDLRFTRNGIKRWIVRCRYRRYRCSKCRTEKSTYVSIPHYGPNLKAFIVYLVVELRLSNQKVADHVSSLFNVSLDAPNIYNIKSVVANKYMPTYRDILRQLAKGPLIHADETKGAVRGGGHYIWVFTNMTTVAYVYAESRESGTLDEVLDGFRGVLVSDFYAGYESVPCAQQKCLIHLMRDINEDLHRNPFDEELRKIAGRFGVLLREIVATIDKHGLKKRYLSKHRASAAGFIEDVISMNCMTEATRALRKRIERNRDKLFTFMEYDGVPWNNNNAEHAVRQFVRLRNTIFNSTPKGHREYATLLSIQQTLRYRGMGFLEFMRSGRMEIPD